MIRFLISIVPLVFILSAHSNEQMIEEITGHPLRVEVQKAAAIHMLVTEKTEVVYSVEAVGSDENFQVFNTNSTVVIELMLANYWVLDGAPHYFMEEIRCPELVGHKVLKEWSANRKYKKLVDFNLAGRYEGQSICLAIMDKDRKTLSWLHSFKFLQEKDADKIDAFLNDLAQNGFGLEDEPYFSFHQISIPDAIQ